MSDEQEAVGKGVRKARRGALVGFRSKTKISGELDPNYAYRIVNDTNDGERIASFRDNDWEVVTKSDITVGDKRVGKPSPEGTPVKISVGQGTQAYLMRKPKEWHEEDQAVKQAEIDAREAGMKPDDMYGSIQLKR